MASKENFFTDRVIWLTGASSGIGRALAIALSKFSCTLYISARNETNLELTRQACADPERVFVVAGDLTDKTVNHTICARIHAHHGRLDMAILNAGTCEYVDVNNFDSDVFSTLMDSNFMSMVYAIEASLPLLKKSRRAQLIGMSSTAAYLGIPRSEAYGATKAAIRNMLRALHVNLKPHGVHVGVICPGFVATELTARNDFAMPALISAERAAEDIIHGMSKQQHEIHFPKRFSTVLKIISILPDKLQFSLLAKTLEN